ncbi:MAG TPA: protein kinase, partial [Polyangia bacterium]|nr:protein kinase [Polyangia bacterium]
MPSRDESHTNIAGEQIGRAQAVDLRRGTVLAGRYQIETVLGQGGAGLVLRAFDRELREIVALKVLRPELGSATRWIERLAREVKLARQIRHPNVCRVFDFEKAEGHFFIVMELASGGTLRREIEDETLLSRPLSARLADARAVASGLAAIHEAGIAHRDVTPQNVLRMADGRLVVSDFGLATEVSQTTTSIHGGTIAYMAPEVVRGDRASFASDVWSLGVVIHEIVFGRRPTWSRPVGGAVLTPPLGRPLALEERRALEVCRACTADLPERRPRSAVEVAASLESGATIRTARRRVRLVFALVALGALGASSAALRSRRRVPAAADEREFAEIPSVPADLSTTGRILATIEDRVQCLNVLPDGHTARFVWGTPKHSEDLDLRTGRRTPSPLVPEAYREGCAELSPDGKRLA